LTVGELNILFFPNKKVKVNVGGAIQAYRENGGLASHIHDFSSRWW
jgi:hypothetical protein